MENNKVESVVVSEAKEVSTTEKAKKGVNETVKRDKKVYSAPKINKPKGQKANSAPRDFQSVKDAIEAKVNAFFEFNQDAGLKKMVSASLLMEAGAHIGLPLKLQNPKMKMFVYQKNGGRNNVIDVLKTLVFLNRAYNFLHEITSAGGTTLFVGTKGSIIKEHIKEEAKRTQSLYVNQRWLGGTLTNFKTISKTTNKLNNLINLSLTDEFAKLPKKERLMINKEIEKKTKFVGGIRTMRKLPEVIIVTDPVVEYNAVNEAKKMGIPVIAITNTNANPELVDFIIPANTSSIRSVYLITSILADAIASATGGETKVVGKEDKDVVLPEIIRQPKRVVFHRQPRREFVKKPA